MAIGQSDGSIILTTKVDQSGLNKGIKTMKSGLNSLNSTIKSIGTTLGVAFGVSALINFGKQATQLASDLQEVQNVVDTAFGSMSYKIEEFSKNAIENFGISQLTAKRTASTYMAMAKGMGIAEDVASDMAITMTGLTADIASFYNMSQERADVILKSVYTGETETLKQLGIVMTEVNLENFAMSKGITKNLSAMTQQEKTMLRYQFVLEQTRLAQGDFSKTQDSFANKTRVLTEKWKEMQAIFGETLIILADGLLPTLEIIVENLTVGALYLSAFVKGMQGVKAETENLIKKEEKMSDINAETQKTTKDMSEALEDLGESANDTAKQFASFDEIEVLGSKLSFTSGAFDEIIPEFSKEYGALQNFLGNDKMKEIQEFQNWVVDNKNGIKTALEVAGLGLLGGAIGGVIGKIGNLLGWFGKKDKGLKTQTDLTGKETSAVYGWATALGGAALGIGALLPGLSKFKEESESTFIPALEADKGLVAEFNTAVQQLEEDAQIVSNDSMPSFAFAMESLPQSIVFATDYINNALLPAFNNVSVYAYNAKVQCDKLQEALNELSNNKQTQTSVYNNALPEFTYDWAKAPSSVIPKTSFEVTKQYMIKTKERQLETQKQEIEQIEREISALETKLKNTAKTKEIFEKLLQVLATVTAVYTGSGALSKVLGGISIPIPAFAKGTVLPGGKPFLAWVNDQPAGQTNIEAPLDTIVDAMNIALQNRGTSDTVKEEHYYLNERELMSVIYRLAKGGENIRGTSLINGGVYS